MGLMRVLPDHDASNAGPNRFRRAAWAGIFVISLFGVLFYAWTGLAIRRQVAEIGRALDAKRFNQAQALIDRLIRTRPDSGDGYYLAARLAWAQKKPEDVLILLAKARERGYADEPMQRLLGLLYSVSGRAGEAEPMLRRAWESSPEVDGEVADALCRIYFESFRFPAVSALIEEWAKRSPDDLRPLLWRGEIVTRNDSGTEAQLKAFDAILERDSAQHATRLNRALILRRVGRLDDARRDYELYIAARPDDPKGHEGAAKTAEGLDDEDEALAHYEQTLKLKPDHVVALIGKAAIQIKRKQAAAALPLLDRAIALSPNDPEPHYHKGLALDRLGRREEAASEFATRVRLQKEQEEIENIRKRLVYTPNNVALIADAVAWLLGHGYDEMGLEWAEKALAKDPKHRATIKLLADFYRKKGDVGRANYYSTMLPADSR